MHTLFSSVLSVWLLASHPTGVAPSAQFIDDVRASYSDVEFLALQDDPKIREKKAYEGLARYLYNEARDSIQWVEKKGDLFSKIVDYREEFKKVDNIYYTSSIMARYLIEKEVKDTFDPSNLKKVSRLSIKFPRTVQRVIIIRSYDETTNTEEFLIDYPGISLHKRVKGYEELLSELENTEITKLYLEYSVTDFYSPLSVTAFGMSGFWILVNLPSLLAVSLKASKKTWMLNFGEFSRIEECAFGVLESRDQLENPKIMKCTIKPNGPCPGCRDFEPR